MVDFLTYFIPFANVLHDQDAYFAIALIYCPYKHAAKIQNIYNYKKINDFKPIFTTKQSEKKVSTTH